MEQWKNSQATITRFNFVIIEVLVALLIVMFGIVGVSSIIPLGMESQRQATGNSYITDAGEQLLRINANNIKHDCNWLNAFANTKPNYNDRGTEWSSSSIFHLNNFVVRPDVNFTITSETNIGLYLLENLVLGQVAQSGIVRLWKEVIDDENKSIDAIIYAEVSWPAEKPYYAREREVFSLQISKPPEISLVNAAYSSTNCSVTKFNGAGYSTTISRVIENNDNTYTVELTVKNSGCSGSECPELSHFSVEAGFGTYSDISCYGVTGTLNLGHDLGNDPFNGFRIDYTSGIGDGIPGEFTLIYTLTDFQDQQFLARAGDSDYIASFSIADFEYVLSCSTNIDFEIVDGEIIPEDDYRAELKVLGCALTDGGAYDMPVAVKANIGGTDFIPWGPFNLPVDGNVNIHAPLDHPLPNTYPAGTPISIAGHSWFKKDLSFSGLSNSHWTENMLIDSSAGGQYTLVLRDGDEVPDITPFQNQSSIETFLQGYIDTNRKVVLNSHEAIFLFELGVTDLSSPAADFQDLVVLVSLRRGLATTL